MNKPRCDKNIAATALLSGWCQFAGVLENGPSGARIDGSYKARHAMKEAARNVVRNARPTGFNSGRGGGSSNSGGGGGGPSPTTYAMEIGHTIYYTLESIPRDGGVLVRRKHCKDVTVVYTHGSRFLSLSSVLFFLCSLCALSVLSLCSLCAFSVLSLSSLCPLSVLFLCFLLSVLSL